MDGCDAAHQACIDACSVKFQEHVRNPLPDDPVLKRHFEVLLKALDEYNRIKAKVKDEDAKASIRANDAAVVFGIGGIGVGVLGGSLGAIGIAGVAIALPPLAAAAAISLGIASFVAWYVGNRYARAALDPPRQDFARVSVFEPAPVRTQRTSDMLAKRLFTLAGIRLNTALALEVLVTSNERLEGAVAASKLDQAGVTPNSIQRSQLKYVNRQAAAAAKAAHVLRHQLALELQAIPSTQNAWERALARGSLPSRVKVPEDKTHAVVDSLVAAGREFIESLGIRVSNDELRSFRGVLGEASTKAVRGYRPPRRPVSDRGLKTMARRVGEWEISLSRIDQLTVGL
jgi:hypothetical protein